MLFTVLAGISIAMKFLEEGHTATFNIPGIIEKEMAFLKLLNYEVYVSKSQYDRYQKQLTHLLILNSGQAVAPSKIL